MCIENQSTHKSSLTFQVFCIFRFAGFDILTLANNHINDYKTRPINYTVDLLQQHGILSFGYSFGSLDNEQPQVSVLIWPLYTLISGKKDLPYLVKYYPINGWRLKKTSLIKYIRIIQSIKSNC